MEIIEETPAFAFKTRDIDTLREAVTAAQYGKENRDLTVYYLYGASGAGKTRSIYQHTRRATSAGLPITAGRTVSDSTPTTANPSWCWKSFTPRSP